MKDAVGFAADIAIFQRRLPAVSEPQGPKTAEKDEP
jgi:hypothetical protein